MKNSNRNVLVYLIMICLVIVFVSWYLRDSEEQDDQIYWVNQDNYGVFGPIVIDLFSFNIGEYPYDSITFSPEIPYRLEQNENIITIWFLESMKSGQEYSITIQTDPEPQTIQIPAENYQPKIVYLSLSDEKVNQLTMIDLETMESSTLSQNDESIQYFELSNSGSYILFALENQSGGQDIWLREMDTGERQQVIDCGLDICIPEDWYPSDCYFLYSRYGEENRSAGLISIQKSPFDYCQNQVQEPFQGEWPVLGENPRFSPDGSYLSYYHPQLSTLVIRSLFDEIEYNFENVGAEYANWNPDGSSVFFVSNEATGAFPYNMVRQADPKTGESINASVNMAFDAGDFSSAVISYDDLWILVGWKAPRRDAAQLYLVSKDGGFSRQITQDSTYTYGAYSFDPSNEYIAFQQYNPNSSSARPNIIVWSRTRGEVVLMIDTAALPVWVP